MKKAKEKIIQAWEENPLLVIGVGAAATTAIAKLIESMASARNTRTWAKEVNRREKKLSK